MTAGDLMGEVARHLQGGQVARAITACQQFVQKFPDEPRVQLKLSELLLRNGDAPGAAKSFVRLAALYEKQGFFAKAIAALRQAQRLQFDEGAARLLASLLEREGHVRDAIEVLSPVANATARPQTRAEVLLEVVRLNPVGAAPRVALAKALVEAVDIPGALREYRAAVERLQREGRQDLILKLIERLHALDQRTPELSRAFATDLLELKEPLRARAVIEPIHRASPEDPEARVLFARICDQLGDHPEALRAYKLHGSALALEGRNEEAAHAWRAALRLAPADPEAQRHLHKLAPPPPLRPQTPVPGSIQAVRVAGPPQLQRKPQLEILSDLPPEPLPLSKPRVRSALDEALATLADLLPAPRPESEEPLPDAVVLAPLEESAGPARAIPTGDPLAIDLGLILAPPEPPQTAPPPEPAPSPTLAAPPLVTEAPAQVPGTVQPPAQVPVAAQPPAQVPVATQAPAQVPVAPPPPAAPSEPVRPTAPFELRGDPPSALPGLEVAARVVILGSSAVTFRLASAMRAAGAEVAVPPPEEQARAAADPGWAAEQAALQGALAIATDRARLLASPDLADVCAAVGVHLVGGGQVHARFLASRMATRRLAADLGIPVVEGLSAEDAVTAEQAMRAGPGSSRLVPDGPGDALDIPAPGAMARRFPQARLRAHFTAGSSRVVLESAVPHRRFAVWVARDCANNDAALGVAELRRRGDDEIALCLPENPATRAIESLALTLVERLGVEGIWCVLFRLDRSGEVRLDALLPPLSGLDLAVGELIGLDLAVESVRLARGEPLRDTIRRPEVALAAVFVRSGLAPRPLPEPHVRAYVAPLPGGYSTALVARAPDVALLRARVRRFAAELGFPGLDEVF